MLRPSFVLLIGGGAAVALGLSGSEAVRLVSAPSWTHGAGWEAVADLPDNEVIEEFCVRCHNDRRLRGNMSLESFDAENAAESAELAERVIRKLRAGMMPPSGTRRPGLGEARA